ncbi:MAG: tetratricopeptide repeat protein [Sedimenticola sp.]|nr:tetratricopeptide repeat protein [Sedimenticola sp.]MCW8921783.1 tetratricopeptide repeat protein [Sedimenticola sp.]MCW8946493.1 tetratricopeptide repeat protein [Sedimenticola sp.]MCW8948418.1 tetratricopeptide repeat protein [Sedimenticola sp.]MCW8975719.1 tetratricopeptide repeat protein [Sedimenticola sp.]
MVDVNLSEEEQVEALKKWWKENGKSVAAGIIIGLGGVFGWQYWTQHQQEVAEQASAQFEQLSQSVESQSPAAVNQAESLIASNQGSAYAVFAALDLAKVKYQQGDVNGAKAQLQWVLDNADDPSLKQIARLRQARILLDEGQVDAAAALIEQAPQDNYRGDVAELRGDIALKRGDKMAARQAYKEAIEYKVSNNALVQMKFDDLAVTE